MSIAMNNEGSSQNKVFSPSGKKLVTSCENCRKLHIKCNSKTPCDNCITKKIPCIRKEKIVGQACGNCRRNHQACDKFRPCKNCRDSGLECVQNKRRQKKKNASAKARVSPRQPGKKTNQEADRIYIWTNYDFQNSFQAMNHRRSLLVNPKKSTIFQRMSSSLVKRQNRMTKNLGKCPMDMAPRMKVISPILVKYFRINSNDNPIGMRRIA